MERFRTMQEKRRMVQRCRQIRPFHYLIVFYLLIILVGISIRILNFHPTIVALALILLFFGSLCFFLLFKAKKFYRKIHNYENSASQNDKGFNMHLLKK
ncbi:hypothetical protein SAMN05421820_10841 [Pedobacter steynii]|uniref:Uncharacterized protein n=1 Tax=Pedobacter steynii TaxID=430522 RepID=A0A1H0C7H5_9SPHI|nr:hypothetical protein SAMN05421820_10841 [Pedobacter steynii]